MKPFNFLQRQRWRPLVIALLIILALAAAWLPSGQLTDAERSHKPQLLIVSTAPLGTPQEPVVMSYEDLIQRLGQRHEWRITEQSAAHVWQLQLSVQYADAEQQTLRLSAQLQAPGQDPAQAERFAVEGRTEVASLLAEQYVKLLRQRIGEE